MSYPRLRSYLTSKNYGYILVMCRVMQRSQNKYISKIMPYFDGTGPWWGGGPGAGWGRGPCGAGWGRGFRRGFGLGWGYGWRRPTVSEEREELEYEAEDLEKELKAIKERLTELKGRK